jgi:predicted lactoylglutathione lyase
VIGAACKIGALLRAGFGSKAVPAYYERMDSMALELSMLGVIVHDMPAALEFYRRLGLAIPDGSEKQSHVEVKMGSGLTFFLDSKPRRWDASFGTHSEPERSAAADRYPVILEFFLADQNAVAAKYTELIDFGYQSYREPYSTSFGMYFAMIKDPDGNTILLSAEAARDQPM